MPTMARARHDIESDPAGEFREGLWKGLDALYNLTAGAGDLQGVCWKLGALEPAAAQLCQPIPPHRRCAAARKIVEELHKFEEFGRTADFNLGLHAAVFVPLEIADRARDVSDFHWLLEESEDIACTACVKHVAGMSRGLADHVLEELGRRQQAYETEHYDC
jgi:hypothetical protein